MHKENKNNDLFNNFFSSMSVFDAHSWECHGACVWCCWCRSRHCYVEPRCAAACLQAEEDAVLKTVFVNREDDLHFFSQPYLFEPEYSEDELREMDILQQNVGSCVACSSRSFIKLRLNHWCHTDYFNDVRKFSDLNFGWTNPLMPTIT